MPLPRIYGWVAAVAAGAGSFVLGADGSSWAGEPNRQYASASTPLTRPAIDKIVRTIHRGTSSNESKLQAISELPMDKLTSEQRGEVQALLDSLSLYRQLATVSVRAEPEVQRYFLERPDIAVSFWRSMEISKFHLVETTPGEFTCDDNDGTRGTASVLYQDKSQSLAICQGAVKSPLYPGLIHASALLHLQHDFVTGEDGNTWCRDRVRMFVSIPSHAVQAAAQLFSPLTNMILDRNLQEVAVFLAVMDGAMARQPGWVEQFSQQVEDMSREDREELLDVTAKVFIRNRQREYFRLHGEQPTIEQVLAPLREAQANRRRENATN
ncbi:hypothetical protein [Thalassoroseus pseudoceratinae]|uniref:hypothetical protein n=1 Tax=Thalassoroseus pseudoceratinae TaxID=2713176 RepID=UPI001420B0D7|nr:hypothetical protein [Thalassoroseus pseudoceratinae]